MKCWEAFSGSFLFGVSRSCTTPTSTTLSEYGAEKVLLRSAFEIQTVNLLRDLIPNMFTFIVEFVTLVICKASILILSPVRL